MNSIIRKFREHKSRSIAIILVISFILSILSALWVCLFLPYRPFEIYISNPPLESPLEGYDELKYEEFDYIQQQNPIESKIRFAENLTFINTTQGGGTEYIIHMYNSFNLDTKEYYLRILHRIAVTALFKIESYFIQNDTWIYNSTLFKWQNPRDNNIFMYFDCDPITHEHYGSVFDDLIINNNLIEENHDWLDLGYSEIGQFKTIQGYGFISILLRNTNAMNAYFGIEEISDSIKTVYSIEKVIFRVEVIWQKYKNHLSGWKTLMNKVYFLGNGIVESKYGLDNLSGIAFMPYDC